MKIKKQNLQLSYKTIKNAFVHFYFEKHFGAKVLLPLYGAYKLKFCFSYSPPRAYVWIMSDEIIYEFTFLAGEKNKALLVHVSKFFVIKNANIVIQTWSSRARWNFKSLFITLDNLQLLKINSVKFCDAYSYKIEIKSKPKINKQEILLVHAVYFNVSLII